MFIHKLNVSNQLLLLDALRFGHLSERILDAYKSQSPLQMIKNVQTIAGQLKTLSCYRALTTPQFDSSLKSIERQATSENTISNGNVQTDSNGIRKKSFKYRYRNINHISLFLNYYGRSNQTVRSNSSLS